MRVNSSKIFGVIFLITSGVFYTIERAVSMLSTHLLRAGFLAGNKGGVYPDLEVNGFFDNFFVPFFFVIGVSLLIYGYKSSKYSKAN